MKQRHVFHYVGPTIALVLAGVSLSAAALDFKFGDGLDAKFNATVTAGTMIRTEAPDSGVYGSLAGPLVGLPAGQLGTNGNSSDLNFKKNKPVSTVLKGVADLEIKGEAFGVFVRAMAWDDFELKSGDRLYGNIPNGFQQNAPLSNAGFASESRFSNAIITDAYVFGKASVGSASMLSGRVGRQVVNWGKAQFTGGGINVINPVNLAAQQRPGALPEEVKIPVGMVYLDLANGKQWGLDGFMQYEFRQTVSPGCGTFFVTANYLPTGCNFVAVTGANDPASLSTNRYLHRSADILARDSGQYGLSLRYSAESLNTEFRGYTMKYHSRTPSLRGTIANVAGGYGTFNPATNNLTRITDPNGAKYGLIYVEDIRLYGVSFDTRPTPSLRAYGEIAYRPNQPLNLNASDQINAFTTRSATSALQLAKNVNAIAPGGTFDAYDRFKVTTLSLGASKVFDKALGAERVTLTGELGWSHVGGLPDLGVLRYGRSDIYGIAAINGQVCTDTTVAQKSCAHDGFITSNASGYRVRVSAAYPAAFFGATLTPTVTLAQDVTGYSYDGSFVKNRRTIIAGMRSEWDKKYYADIQYTQYSGANYFTLIDRDNVTLVLGMKF
ncbi:DUF1302 domain-containing protein [Sulfuritalea hydrogenivorans]|uniref:DUF1302 domain-containing protein n=1 Tax=Sulfuritalea hydrogenivorans sk43H TaxID=1223802 RepID=W0SAV0_9PROT|nr:DUF1302 domain-containing protein [Sulfuritalea hydrogenivorans]BAO28324.1 hypothetical protein SUTH_00510 [Sulfuritalea hydrogenivorans sk43H]